MDKKADGEGFDTVDASACAVAELQQSANVGEAESEAVGRDFDPGNGAFAGLTDPDLARVIVAWPTLPADVKARIVEMVKAARRDGAEG